MGAATPGRRTDAGVAARTRGSSPPPRPAYRDLPAVDGSTARHAWGLYGRDDQLGTVNLLTPDVVREAASCIRTGERYVLSLPLDYPSPALFGRQAIEHTVMRMGDLGFDDRLDAFYPQGSTQWDALSHFGHTSGFYNHRSHGDVEAGRLGMMAIAEVGIAGRGVLLDVARFEASRGPLFGPTTAFEITPELLAEVAADEGVTLRAGDVLCVRTGWVGWYLGLDEAGRAEVAQTSTDYAAFHVAGLSNSDAMAEYLWDSGVVAVAADNPTVEMMPVPARTGTPAADDALHTRVIGLLGFTLGEFFVLDALAEACAADGRYEFFLTSAPLLIPGGVGSPPNVLAIR